MIDVASLDAAALRALDREGLMGLLAAHEAELSDEQRTTVALIIEEMPDLAEDDDDAIEDATLQDDASLEVTDLLRLAPPPAPTASSPLLPAAAAAAMDSAPPRRAAAKPSGPSSVDKRLMFSDDVVIVPLSLEKKTAPGRTAPKDNGGARAPVSSTLPLDDDDDDDVDVDGGRHREKKDPWALFPATRSGDFSDDEDEEFVVDNARQHHDRSPARAPARAVRGHAPLESAVTMGSSEVNKRDHHRRPPHMMARDDVEAALDWVLHVTGAELVEDPRRRGGRRPRETTGGSDDGGGGDGDDDGEFLALFHATLRDGVLLCELLNSLEPGLVVSFDEAPRSDAQYVANVECFLHGCLTLGVPARDCCRPQDIVEAADLGRAQGTIRALSDAVRKSCRGFKGDLLETFSSLAPSTPPSVDSSIHTYDVDRARGWSSISPAKHSAQSRRPPNDNNNHHPGPTAAGGGSRGLRPLRRKTWSNIVVPPREEEEEEEEEGNAGPSGRRYVRPPDPDLDRWIADAGAAKYADAFHLFAHDVDDLRHLRERDLVELAQLTEMPKLKVRRLRAALTRIGAKHILPDDDDDDINEA